MKVRSLASTVFVVALAVAWFLWFAPTNLGGRAEYILVSGHSMEPTYVTGDLVVLHRAAGYRVGDIVAYHPPAGDPAHGRIIIHRIVGGDRAAGFIIRGDNNPEPDPWRPTPDLILGRSWLHVPGVQGWLRRLEGPITFPLTVMALAAFVIGPGARKVRRRKKGRQMTPEQAKRRDQSGTRGTLFGPFAEAPVPLIAGLAVAGVLAVSAMLVAFLLFRQPATVSQTVTRLSYQQQASFDYAVSVAPSVLYPDGTVGPAAQSDKDGNTPAEQPVYTTLARSMDVAFAYQFASDGPARVHGTLRVDLEVGPAGGWTHTEQLLAARPFQGPSVDARVRLDFASIAALITRVEGETGFVAQDYQLRVVPHVTLTGGVGDQPVDTVYAPVFTTTWNRTRITPDASLERAQPTAVTNVVVSERTVSLAGAALPVLEARTVAAATAAGAAVLAALLAAAIYLGLGRSGQAKIRARYGSMLLRVAEADDDAARDRVRVTSMRDLARLAQRDGGIIFEEADGPVGPRYVVRDGETLYEYLPPSAPSRGRLLDVLLGGTSAPGVRTSRGGGRLRS